MLPYLISDSHFTDAFYQGFKVVIESWHQHGNSDVGLDNSAMIETNNYSDQRSLPVKFIITVECNKKVPGWRIYTGVG